MSSVYKRPSDKARGKAGKWTMCFVGADGKKKQKVGVTDKAESLRIANKLEREARLVREGLLDPAEKDRREAGLRALSEHLDEYRAHMIAKGGTAKHADRTSRALRRLLASASITSVASLAFDRIQKAIGDMAAEGTSARTCNFYLAAVKTFATWLELANRVDRAPRGLMGLKPRNEKEDRRLVRRALTKDELDRLLEATEMADPIEASRAPRAQGFLRDSRRWITGPERAALYRLAMGTGFRARELRTLTPERFHLDGDEPSVEVLAGYEKNGKGTVQPITRELAAGFRPFLEGKESGKPVLEVPIKTAKMLRADLERAGIPYKDKAGRVVDFHALRGSYVTHLIMAGVNPKIVQALARHSTITLTLDRYTTIDNSDLRKALEGE